MILDESKSINMPFEKWISSHCKNLKLNDVSKIVISISLENLQMYCEWTSCRD